MLVTSLTTVPAKPHTFVNKVRTASETPGQLVSSDDSQTCRHVLPNVNDRVKSATFQFSFQFELKPGNQIKILVLLGEYEG